MSDDYAGSKSTSGSISVGGSKVGTIEEAFDRDWFAISLVAGQTYTFGLGKSGVSGLSDPYLSLFNSSGSFLASDDDGGEGLNSLLLYTAAYSGVYYLEAQAYDATETGAYLLTASTTGSVIAGDRFENNDTSTTPTVLGSISGTVTESNLSVQASDADWYRFTLPGPGRTGDAVTLNFSHSLGDVDMVLWNSTATASLGASTSVGNQEQISLAGLAAGTYLVQVYGYGGASNPTYSLSVSAAPVGVSADRFEDNDTAGSPTVLGTISGTVTQSALTVQSGDSDWYRITLGGTGRIGDQVAANFTHALGDVDMELYSSAGTTLLASSAGVGNQEVISLAGRAAGNYLVRVFGYAGASNPNYSLSVTAAPQGVSADRFEENDTSATPTVMGTISGSVTQASLTVQSNDHDWYRFTLPGPGRTGDAVTLNFSHALGDVDMQLYNSAGTVVQGKSTGVGNQEQISLAGLPAGTYLLDVYGYAGASNPAYSLNVNAAPQGVTADRFEDNDTAGTATDLRSISGTVTESGLTVQSGDADWFKFTLAGAGRSGDAVTLNFTHALGDVDMQLYNSAGTTLLASSGGVGNQEQISLAGLAAGTYLVKVYGYAGASNPSYSISVSAAPQAVTADRFEDNDNAGTATDLRIISGTVTESALTVQASDADWFKFTMPVAGRAGDAVTVNFTHSLGDVDIELYNSAGTTLLGSSAGVGNQEQVSLAGLAAGTYLVKVIGYSGATNPAYSISVSVAPQGVTADRFEDNDTAGTATDLRTISGTVTESSLTVQSADADWYRFTLASAGRTGDGATVNFSHALGDVDMQLYNAAGTAVLATSAGTGNQELVSFAGLAAGSYQLRVYGYGSASNPDYSLSLTAPQGLAADRFEDNDTAATATNLRTISGAVTEANLSMQAGDPDWYSFTLDSAGRQGDTAVLNFTHAQGDVDMQLYNSAGTDVLASSGGTGNQEVVSLAGLAAGTYLLKVYGYSGAANPNYSLGISVAPQLALSADQWENNDTSGVATVIRDAAQTLSGATITAGDQDWFKLTLPQTGAATDRVVLHTAGTGLQVKLLNAQLGTVATTTSDATGLATIPLTGDAAGQYYVQVTGQTAQTQAQYDLEVRAQGLTPVVVNPVVASSWTVLVFVNGDNNLESAAIEDINEMEASLNRAGVNVGVLVDRVGGYDTSNGNWTDARRGVIVHDTNTTTISSTLISQGEIDMGSAAQLTSFVNWGTQNLPAQHYMVIVWDHGGGTLSGSSFDDTSGAHLTNAAVAQAIAASQIQHVDILGFDACLMGSIEIASEIEPVADLLIGSERTEPGDGWDYTALLNYLQANSTATGLASSIVDSYGTFYGQGQPLSAITLNGVTAVETAIDGFVSVMTTGTAADWQAVIAARPLASTADAGYSQYVDINSFMRQVMTQSANATLDAAAQAVITAVENAVMRKSGPASLYGLTIEFPIRGTTLSGVYTAANYDFVADTTWENFIAQYLSRSVDRAASDPGAPDFAEFLTLSALSNSLRNDTINTPFQIGNVSQADYVLAGLGIESADDADWFTFTMPAGAGLLPTAAVQVAGPVAGVHARLLSAQGVQIAEATSTAGVSTLSFSQTTAGTTYLLEVTAPGAATQPGYELHLNAFGNGVTATALPDFAEAGGGNNDITKAWQVGNSGQLALYGDIRNLSLDDTDLAGGAAGGDWFRVDSTRVTEANVNRVEVVNVSNGAGNLTIKVFDINGNLVAQSSQAGDLAVEFPAQVDDIFVQVNSGLAQPVLSYALRLANDQTPPINGTDAADTLGGTSGNDTIYGFGGNDTLTGLAGDDSLDGSTGIDMAVYTGGRSAYTVNDGIGNFTVASAGEGTDTLVNVERLHFSDGYLALDLDGAAGSVAKILGVLFGAASVSNSTYAGIGIGAMDAGLTYEGLMGAAIGIVFPGISNAALVDLMFFNLAGFHPDTATALPFVNYLDTGALTQTQLAVLAADTAINAANIDLAGLTQNGLAYTI
jgi:hypothetical protein